MLIHANSLCQNKVLSKGTPKIMVIILFLGARRIISIIGIAAIYPEEDFLFIEL
jgi:hypothetical protein